MAREGQFFDAFPDGIEIPRCERGEAVIIRDAGGRELGRGLIAYSSEEASLIAGRNSMEIQATLGYAGRAALIHRDDMALLRDLV